MGTPHRDRSQAMLTQLHAKHFKSWGDTGPVRLAPLTGYFGTNSSGKSALLQILLLQKQTIESSDRHRILHTGANDPRAYVDLGTPTAIAHQGNTTIPLEFAIAWTPPTAIQLPDPNNPNDTIAIDQLQFSTEIRLHPPIPSLQAFTYQFPYRDRDAIVGLQNIGMPGEAKHRLIAEGFQPRILSKISGEQNLDLHLNDNTDPGNRRSFWLTPAVKYYGFFSELQSYLTYLNDLVTAYERQFDRIYYLGPLREYPQRLYLWSGERPSDVGRRGELAIATLLAARGNTPNDPSPLELAIGHWLQQLDLIHSFRVSAIAPGRQEYELLVRRTATSTEVPITDVGFGISQILPVLTLCYSVPPAPPSCSNNPKSTSTPPSKPASPTSSSTPSKPATSKSSSKATANTSCAACNAASPNSTKTSKKPTPPSTSATSTTTAAPSYCPSTSTPTATSTTGPTTSSATKWAT